MELQENNFEKNETPKQLKFSELTEQSVADILALYVEVAQGNKMLAQTVTLEKIKQSLLNKGSADYRLGSGALMSPHTKLRFNLDTELQGGDYSLKIFIFPNVDKDQEVNAKKVADEFNIKLQEYLAQK